MSDRLVRNLVIVLAILAVTYGVLRLVASRAGGSESPYDLAGIAAVEVDSMLVEGDAETIRLWEADGWKVNGYDAIPEAGDAVSRALETTRVGEVVSRNPDNHNRLGVEESQARRLSIFAEGEERLALLVSGKGQTFDDAYVRRPDSEEVRVMRGNLVDLARRGVDGWRDKQIVGASAEELRRIELTYPDTGFAMARDSAGWAILPDGDPAGEQAAAALVRELAGLRAIGFAADSVADTLTWDAPAGRVRVMGADDAEFGDLTFLARESSGYYVRRADKPVVYTISQYAGDQVLKRAEELARAPDGE